MKSRNRNHEILSRIRRSLHRLRAYFAGVLYGSRVIWPNQFNCRFVTAIRALINCVRGTRSRGSAVNIDTDNIMLTEIHKIIEA